MTRKNYEPTDTFMDKFDDGEVTLAEIEDHIDAYYEQHSNEKLSDFLGMTPEELEMITKNPLSFLAWKQRNIMK